MKRKDWQISFSKKIIASVIIFGIIFLVWCCYEMHRLNDLTPLAYIGGGVIGLMATAIGFYVWRARATDAYELAKQKLNEEKELGRTIEVETFKDDMMQFK